jgi:AcrR family transcriptional regulator
MAAAAEFGANGETRERILCSALRDFSVNGFDGARTREIAARAGVPLGLLRYHFGDKARLWRAAVDRAFSELRGGLEAILADPQPADLRERLHRLIRGHVRFVAGNPEFVRLMHDEGKRGGARMRWMVDRHVKPAFGALVPLIERAQTAGILPLRIDPIHFIYALVGAVGVIFHQAEECKRLSGIDPAHPAAVEAHALTVEHLFLGANSKEILS